MTAPVPPSEDAPHWARPLYEQQIAMAGELAQAALAMALTVKDQSETLTQAADVEPAVLEGLSRAFARLARAVRLSLLLQDRLIKDLIAFDKKVAFDAAWDQGQQARDRKALAGHVIERVIERAHNDGEEAERLIGETAERLDREDLYGLVLSHPVSELVAMICQDLGLDPDWPRLATEAWAQAEMAGEAVGWPLKSSPIGGGGPNAKRLVEGENPIHPSSRQSPSTASRSPSPDGGGISGVGLASP